MVPWGVLFLEVAVGVPRLVPTMPIGFLLVPLFLISWLLEIEVWIVVSMSFGVAASQEGSL
eukprot:6973013-Pyramimonas_sp.AAC.1